MATALFGAAPARADDCCTVKRDGDHLIITGKVHFKGAKYMETLLQDARGNEFFAERCTAPAPGEQNVAVKLTIPVRLVPNGTYRVANKSANADYTRYYTTPSDWFDVTNSPAVRLVVKSGPGAFHKSSSATFGFSEVGDVRKTQCRLDGKPWSRCASPKTFSGLAEGRHTVGLRAVGAEGFMSAKHRTFRVDLSPPTPPTLDVIPGAGTVTVTAHGSRDLVSGVKGYEYQLVRDGTVSPIIRADAVTVQGTGWVLNFRAVDGAGRHSSWAKVVFA